MTNTRTLTFGTDTRSDERNSGTSWTDTTTFVNITLLVPSTSLVESTAVLVDLFFSPFLSFVPLSSLLSDFVQLGAQTRGWRDIWEYCT